MASALGGFVGGLQQGYTFVADAQNKQAEEARRVKEDARRDQDAAFQEETRGQKRIEWNKDNQYKSEVDSLNNSFFPPEQKAEPEPALGIQAAPVASAAPVPAMAPADATAGGAAPASSPESIAAPAPAAPSAPAATGGAAPGSSAIAPPALGLAQSAPQPGAASTAPAAGLPAQANKLTSMGTSMDYLIQRAQIDMRHGKTDGAGIANLYKLRNSAAKEGLNDAVQLLAQGDNEGAMRRFNEGGDMKDWTVQSSVDGVFEHGGVKIPTKIVTVKAADGTTRTVNTAQTLVQNQLIDAIVAQAQKGTTMDDTRNDAAAGRKIQQQNADTQEQYRKDQATNMEEQRRLQERGIDARLAAGAPSAPIWSKEDDTFLKEQYSGKDEVSGAKTFDGEGLQFAKQVAVARSRSNGGDAATASAYALAADTNLKAQAKGDPVKLRELRSKALRQLAMQAPSTSPTGGPEWEARSAASRAGAPAREAGRREILEQELADAKDPRDIASIKRELAGLGPSATPASTASSVANPVAPPPAVAPVAARPAAAPATASATGAVQLPDGSIDVRGDTVIASLRQSLSAINANDPRNTDVLMKLGTAMNQRIEQLQNNYGSMTKLITQ